MHFQARPIRGPKGRIIWICGLVLTVFCLLSFNAEKKKDLFLQGLFEQSLHLFFFGIRKSDFFLNDRWLLSVFTVFPPFYQRWVELTLDCHWIEVRSVDPLDPLSTKWDDCRKLEVFLFRQRILTLHQRLLRLPFHGVRILYLCGCARNLTVELPLLDFNFLFSLKEFSNFVFSKSPPVVSALWACGFAWPSCGFYFFWHGFLFFCAASVLCYYVDPGPFLYPIPAHRARRNYHGRCSTQTGQ